MSAHHQEVAINVRILECLQCTDHDGRSPSDPQRSIEFPVNIQFGTQLLDPRLNRGQLISLEGCSLLRWNADGKVERHRDYFDAGALLYQHVPLLGSAIRWLQRRLA